MAYVQLRNITKNYGSVEAVKPLNLEIEEGEFVSLLGPSGCGKTTILRMLAGFVAPSTGDILLAGNTVFSKENGKNVPPEKRNIGMVFQTYAVWPHMNVFKNIAYPLTLKKMPRDAIETRVNDVLDLVQLKGFDTRYPHELSGGQQQRVALARALIAEPAILLLDEPLSGLDAKLRETMAAEIHTIWQRTGITVVYVTHDQREAMTLSDRIILMKDGVIEQSGAPDEIYERPTTLFSADFLGKANIVAGRVSDDKKGVALSNKGTIPVQKLDAALDDVDTHFLLRPEHLHLWPLSDGQQTGIKGTITSRKYFGSYTEYQVQVDEGQSLTVETKTNLLLDPGTEVQVSADKATAIRERTINA